MVCGRNRLTVMMRLRAEMIGIPHPVSAVIFGVAFIKGAVVTHAPLHNKDARQDDFLTRACNWTAIDYRVTVVCGRKDAARGEASDCGSREKLDFYFHKIN